MYFADKQACRETIEADLYRYTGKTDRRTLRKYRRQSSGFRFTYYLRMCGYTRERTVLKYTLFPFYKWCEKRAGSRVGIEVNDLTPIGKGLHIAHTGCIVIHSGAVLGENVTVSQGVTIGQTIKNGEVLVPVIGNNVYIAPGAKVIGGIYVGNNVAIGANAVVNKDVPDNAVVAGVPARVLHMGGAGEYLHNPYPGKDAQ